MSCTDYSKLDQAINRLMGSDDGILLNQKFRLISEEWARVCTENGSVKKSVRFLYKKCLNEHTFSWKVVSLLTSATFASFEIHGQNIRNLFLREFHRTYEQVTKNGMETNILNGLARIIGFFIFKSRTGQNSFLVKPYVKLLCLCISSSDPTLLKTCALQLYLNYRNLGCDDTFSEVLHSARMRMVSAEEKPGTRLWLMASLEFTGTNTDVEAAASFYNLHDDKEFIELHMEFVKRAGEASVQGICKSRTIVVVAPDVPVQAKSVEPIQPKQFPRPANARPTMQRTVKKSALQARLDRIRNGK